MDELCVRCGKVERYPGHTLCLDCLIRMRERSKDYWQKHSEELLPKKELRNKARREELYSKGLCVQCGKRKHVPGRKRCQSCLNKARIRSRKQYARDVSRGIHTSIQIRKEIGMCIRCNEQAVDGYCLCQKHLEAMRKIQRMGAETTHQVHEMRKQNEENLRRKARAAAHRIQSAR